MYFGVPVARTTSRAPQPWQRTRPLAAAPGTIHEFRAPLGHGALRSFGDVRTIGIVGSADANHDSLECPVEILTIETPSLGDRSYRCAE